MTSPENRPELDSDAEPLIDALLDEVLGGHGPPDLRQKILERGRDPQLAIVEQVEEQPAAVPIVVPALVDRRVTNVRGRRRSLPAWSWITTICLVAVLATFWVYRRSHPARDVGSVVEKPRTTRPLRRPPRRPLPRLGAPNVPGPDSVEGQPTGTAGQSPVVPQPDSAGSEPNQPSASDNLVPAGTSSPPAPPPEGRLAGLDDAAMVAQVNQRLQQRWQTLQIDPAPGAKPEDWCRRVFVTLIGRAPNAGELRAYHRGDSDGRNAALVDHLLGPSHADEFANFWSRRWANWLLEFSVGGSRAYRAGLQKYLAETLRHDSRYDRICLELITASGSNDASRDDFQGATNYLLALEERADAAAVAGQLCRAMLGQQAACAQCHDDALRGRTQQQFWQLAASLSSIRIELYRVGRGQLRDAERPDEVSLTYAGTDGQSISARPGGWDGQLFTATDQTSLRAQLAQELVGSDDFARALVNRCWEAMFEYGFTLPVDDMGEHNPPSHPELLNFLSEQFVAHGYDVKQLMRWLVLSDAFARSDTTTAGNAKDDPAVGGVPLFSRAYQRPRLFALPNQGLDRLAAGEVPHVKYDEAVAQHAPIFGIAPSDFSSGSPEATTIGTLPPGQLLPSHILSLIRALDAQSLTREQKFEHAFHVVLGRRPTGRELASAEAIFTAAGNDPIAAMERVYWALLNTRRP
jgi:hypothetical protein